MRIRVRVGVRIKVMVRVGVRIKVMVRIRVRFHRTFTRPTTSCQATLLPARQRARHTCYPPGTVPDTLVTRQAECQVERALLPRPTIEKGIVLPQLAHSLG